MIARRASHDHIPLRADDALALLRRRGQQALNRVAKAPPPPPLPAPVRVTVDWLDGPLWLTSLDAQYSSHIYHAATRILALFDAQVGGAVRLRVLGARSLVAPSLLTPQRSNDSSLGAAFPHGSPYDGYLAPLDESNYPPALPPALSALLRRKALWERDAARWDWRVRVELRDMIERARDAAVMDAKEAEEGGALGGSDLSRDDADAIVDADSGPEGKLLAENVSAPSPDADVAETLEPRVRRRRRAESEERPRLVVGGDPGLPPETHTLLVRCSCGGEGSIMPQ